MYLYGASGHAKVVKEILESAGKEVKAIFDDNTEIKALQGFPVSGAFDPECHQLHSLIITIGYNEIRSSIAKRLKNSPFGKAIHPKAIVSNSASIGAGSVVMAGAVINAATTIGSHVIVNTSSSIDHDCGVSDYVHIAPHATLCGGVKVEEGALIGAGATLIPLVKVGKWATIGAGAVVVSDIPDYAVAVGNPARVIKYHKPENV
jgi:sugar O-acyltransferase (sialic acid O-acetyltransferase NeuD family)